MSSCARVKGMRLEDPDLLIGASKFVADLEVPDCLHAHFVRSAEAHANVVAVDVSEAEQMEGVIAVFTGETIGLERQVHVPSLPLTMTRYPLVKDTVRHVGEAVAVVIAETREAAEDAAEFVFAELAPLEPIVVPERSEAAPPMYPDAGTNLVHQIDDGAEDPVVGADVIVEVHVRNSRLTSVPMENDGVVVTPTDGGLDVWATSQGVHGMRSELAAIVGLSAEQIRVRAPAVGGGFGGRVALPVEFTVVAKAAILLGRSVRWLQGRVENLTGMSQGRDIHSTVRLGLTGAGDIVGMDFAAIGDAGSAAHGGAGLLVSVRRQAAGLYRTPKFRWKGKSVLTNTPPVGAYRGAGQPEANHARERALDIAAIRLGMDPVELRRRNLYTRDDFPLTAAGEVTYDSADPVEALDHAVMLVRRDHWRREQSERRSAEARHEIGIGFACYSQTSGRGNPTDSAVVQIHASGRVSIACGSPSHGQGHLTTWANLVSTRLGVDPLDVDVVDSDTAAIDRGLTTGGSRASQVLASALLNACDDLVEAGRPIAANELEAAEDDIVVVAAESGLAAGLSVKGVPSKRVTWAAIASGTDRGCLEAIRDDATFGEAHPYGTHASIVEVDTDTGHVRLIDHVAVDDCGVVLEPEIVQGQQHGGAIAGVSQALWEFMSFDADGNPETAMLTNYAIPSAVEVGTMTTATMNAVSDRNIIGSRGIGENGCNGATAAAHNAVIDALSNRGVEHIDLPLTPQRVWRSIREMSPVIHTPNAGV